MNNLRAANWLVALQILKRAIGNPFAFVPSRDLQMHTGEGRKDGDCVCTYVCKAKDGFLGGVKPEGGILVCVKRELVSL